MGIWFVCSYHQCQYQYQASKKAILGLCCNICIFMYPQPSLPLFCSSCVLVWRQLLLLPLPCLYLFTYFYYFIFVGGWEFTELAAIRPKTINSMELSMFSQRNLEDYYC